MKLIFKSLISNNSAIDGARKKGKWWIAIILGFISIILSVIPTLVKNITIKGSDALGNPYGMDFAIQYFVEYSETNNIKIIVHDADDLHESKYITVSGSFSKTEYQKDEKTDAVFAYLPVIDVAERDNLPSTEHSVVVFDETTFYFSVSNPVTKQQTISGRTYSCAYDEFADGTDLIEFIGKEYPGSWKNFLKLVDNVVKHDVVLGAWITTGMMAGIYLFIMLLMGFMVWILTRGKTNPFRMYTILDGFKIAAWCSLAPAIITIPAAFLITGLPDMWFAMLLGIRVMWLTMHSLRPDGTGYTETVEKEVKTVKTKNIK